MTIAFEEVKREALKNPKVRAEYDALAERYALIRRIVSARAEAGLTQREIAERMGTTQSVIARLEGGKISPSLDTLYKYAQAVGVRAVISFEPVAQPAPQ